MCPTTSDQHRPTAQQERQATVPGDGHGPSNDGGVGPSRFKPAFLMSNEKSVPREVRDRDCVTPWLDVQRAAAWALCSSGTILREARAGRLRGYKIGGRRCWRFLAEDVDRWLKQQADPIEYAPASGRHEG